MKKTLDLRLASPGPLPTFHRVLVGSDGNGWGWTYHVGSCVRNSPIEEPVGRCGHGKAAGAGLEGKDLAGDDPGAGSPGAGEEEDVDADL